MSTRILRSLMAALIFSLLSTSHLLGSSVGPQSISDFFVGRPAPDFKLKDLEGRDVQLSSLRGNIVLLDFWASWCGPCREEIPMIEHLAKQFEKKNLIVIGVNSEEPADVVRRFVAKNKLTYPVVLTVDNPTVIRSYAARALPTVAIIDKNGIIAAYRVGASPHTEEILHDDIHHVSSSKYVAPRPKPVQMAQIPPAPPNTPLVSPPAGPDPNWQPKTADEFLARGYAYLRVHRNPEASADAVQSLKLRPDCPMALFLHGRATYEEKNYLAAIDDFNKVIQQKPNWAQGYHYRGLAYSYDGQHQRAVPEYQKVIELTPYLPAAYNDLGWAYRELGQFDQAKTNLDKAIEMEPDYTQARENRAILFGKQGDRTAELNELAIILGIAPNDQWAKNTKQAILQNETSPLTAQQPLPQASRPDVMPRVVSKVDPEYSEEARRAGVSTSIGLSVLVNAEGLPQNVRVVRGAGFGLDEKAVQAVSTWRFEPATKRGVPVSIQARIEENFRLLIGNHENQTSRLNFILPPGASRPELVHGKVPDNPKDSSDAKLRVALSVGADGKPQDVSLLETTSAEWAEDVMRKMMSWRFRPATINGQPAVVKGIFELIHGSPGADSLQPSEPNPKGPDPSWQPTTADEFLARGYARLRIEKYPQAKADAEDALKLRPNSPVADFLHGRATYGAKDYSAAAEDFDKVIQERPDWPDAYRFRGLAYSYSSQHQRALVDYQKAIELNPYSAPAYNTLGWAYTELGQLDQAKTNLDRAVELDPAFILARENRAKLFAKQGDLSAEQNELSVILGLSPNNQWAKDTQEAVLQKQGGAR